MLFPCLDPFIPTKSIVSIGAYSKCVACSESVLNALCERGNDFLFEVFNDPTYLEDVTGLSKLKAEIDENFGDDIIALSDSDQE